MEDAVNAMRDGIIAQREGEEARRLQANRREVRQNAIRQTELADGSTIPGIRKWIQEIELASPVVGAANIIEVISQTVSGSLRKEVERFITAQGALVPPVVRANVPWADLRAHVVNTYLGANEDENLRRDLESMKQGAYDSENDYTLKFKHAAEVAYPEVNRGEIENRIILHAYVSGLADKDLRKELWLRRRPGNLNEAMTAVRELSNAEKDLCRFDPVEPAPIAAVSAVCQAPVKTPTDEKSHSGEQGEMMKLLNKISSRIGELKVAEKQPTEVAVVEPMRLNYNNPRPKGSKVGVCFNCNKPGHFARDCRSAKQPASRGDSRPPRGKCFNCGRFGHYARECHAPKNPNTREGYRQRPQNAADASQVAGVGRYECNNQGNYGQGPAQSMGGPGFNY